MIEDLHNLVCEIDDDPSLFEADELRRRLVALHRLDAFLPEAFPAEFESDPATAKLFRRADTIRLRLEGTNQDVYHAVRNEIQSSGRADLLLRWVRFLEAEETTAATGMGYDHLDEVVSGVFAFEEPKVIEPYADPEMVFYQPTPARHIFRLLQLAQFTADDVLVDLGSGLGHVGLLVSLCTATRSVGIEREAAFVQSARRCAESLNLNGATFFHQDARDADLSSGTVFYLHTPFRGAILEHVLRRLRNETRIRPIRICTYGPCTSVISQERWLEATARQESDRITLFHSCA